MKVHYICNYTHNLKEEKLKVQPSGVNKISYVLSLLQRSGINTTLCSFAGSKLNDFFITSRVEYVNKNLKIIYPALFSEKNILFKIIAKLWLQIYLLYYLFFKIKKNDKLLVYHSLQYKFAIRVIRLFRPKLNVYFEVEEIYNAAWSKSTHKIKTEIKLLRNADGYIFVNDFINKKCNFNSNNNLVLYGDYRIVPTLPNNYNQIKDNHIVYAGVVSKDSDVYLAISIMNYLPNRYKLSILGYGTENDINDLKEHLRALNLNNVEYIGVLYDEEYQNFLSSCKYGLCTRMLPDELSLYTYPSKVCSYITNGVIPICPPITVLKNSGISSNILFTENLDPKSIARSILENTHFELDYSIMNDLNTKAIVKVKSIFQS